MQAEMSDKQISDIREGKAHGRVDLGEREDKSRSFASLRMTIFGRIIS
jgi:hypothetical protein